MLEYFFLSSSWLTKARPSFALTRSPSELYFITVFADGDVSLAAKGTSSDVVPAVAGVGLALGFTRAREAQMTIFGRPLRCLTCLLVSEVEESVLPELFAARVLHRTVYK